MKKYVVAFTLAFFLLSVQCFAQGKPKYIPEKGYWQLESTVSDKKTVTVKFFSERHELMYQETLAGSAMNPERKKVRRQLYYALQDAYNQWAFNKKVSSTNLVAKRK